MVKPQSNKHKSRIVKRKSRRKLGSRAYKNYTEDMLKLACESVSSKQISSRDAERQFGIPRRTIVNKIKNIHSNSVGHPTVMTSAEEKKIVKVLQASSDYGSPLTKLDLKLLVYEYLKQNSREHTFQNKIPGDAWVQGFLSRHADELSVRTTQNISKSRAEKSPQEISTYFENLRLNLKDIPPTNIVNLDETNLSDDPGKSKCIFRRGVRYPERIANSTKGNISLMFTAVASGQTLPLYVVYKATNLYSEWITGGPPGTRYNCTKSGWFDSAMFEDYFERIIVPWAEETPGTKVVICDNLSSHLNVKVVELCEQCNIKFIFIPPRSTHLTQPLDVAFFAPLKKAWRQILYQYKLKNPNQTSLNKKHFPKLLIELTEAINLNEAKNIKSGFRASGIYPLNPQEVLKKIPEMQEEILYGLDHALLDYLKHTRAPKPIEVKRNKKVNCEPGKSVTVTDLNITCDKKDTSKGNAIKKINIKNNLKTVQQNKNGSVFYLDEKTGLFNHIDILSTNNNEISNKYLKNQSPDDRIFYDLDSNLQKTIVEKSPDTLSEICRATINLFLIHSADKMMYTSDIEVSEVASGSRINPLIFENYENSPNYMGHLEPVVETRGKSFKKCTPKINILSNVIIKAAKQTSNVKLLNKISKFDEENTPFIARSNRDLPKCLQRKATKSFKIKKENVNRKQKKITNKNNQKVEKGTEIFFKRKKRQSLSSSTSTNSSINLLTDNSDCETTCSYFSEFLYDQDEKENWEPKELTLDPININNFTEGQGELNEGDWVIVRFATQRSLKHFVGKILSISDKKPTVIFLRKVKQSKCDNGTTFTYPIVEDVSTIQYLEDIISILPEPTISRRGQIIFNVDFSKLNIQ